VTSGTILIETFHEIRFLEPPSYQRDTEGMTHFPIPVNINKHKMDHEVEMQCLNKSDKIKSNRTSIDFKWFSSKRIIIMCALMASCGIFSFLVVGYIVCSTFISASTEPSHNILVLGGQSPDLKSDLSLELVNVGGCPPDLLDTSFPVLPGKLGNFTASYREDIAAVSVCGERKRNSSNVCWLLGNGTSHWRRSDILDTFEDDVIDDSLGEHPHQACSHRHGASVIALDHDKYFMVGGKSCGGEYPSEVLQLLNSNWEETSHRISKGRLNPKLVKIPCDFKIKEKSKLFHRLLEMS